MKKLILLIVFATIVFGGAAYANDGGLMLDDDECLLYDYNVKSDSIAINEEMVFELTLTNKTEYNIDGFGFGKLFNNTTNREYEDILDDIKIEPYQTKTFAISYVVPEEIEWYKKGDKYYTDFAPTLTYLAEEEDCKYIQLYWGAYNENDKVIPLEITNIEDGEEYLDIRVLDDRKYRVYSETQYPVSNMYEEHFDAINYNYFGLKNISEEDIDIVGIRGLFAWQDYDNSYIIKKSEMINIRTRVYNNSLPKDVQSTETIGHSFLFKADGGYKGVYLEKEYETMILPIPNVEIDVNLDDEGKVIDCSLVNKSGQDIENFFVIYSDEFPRTFEELDNSMICNTFAAGDIWELPVQGIDYGYCSLVLRMGYKVEDCLYYWTDTINSKYHKNEPVNMKERWYEGGRIDDMYADYNNIEFSTLYLGDTFKPMPEIDVKETATPTATPEVTPSPIKESEIKATDAFEEEKDIDIEETTSSYIPMWSIVVLAIFFGISGGLIVVLRKKKDE